MKKGTKITLTTLLLGVAVIVILIVSALVMALRPLPLDAEEQQALAAMEEPPSIPREGTNAWVTVITAKLPNLTYEQRQVVADRYVAEYTSSAAIYTAAKQEGRETNVSWPEYHGYKDYELTPPLSQDSLLCGFGTSLPDCFSVVRQQPEVIAKLLAPYADVIELAAELSHHGHYYSPLLPPRVGQYYKAQFFFFRLTLSAHALTHIHGDSRAALVGLCRDAHTGRILISHSQTAQDPLELVMTGRWILENNLELAAHIIAELPLDTPLPTSCVTAFVPLPMETLSLCSVIRSQQHGILKDIETGGVKVDIPDLDWQHIVASIAQDYSRFGCPPEKLSMLVEDEKYIPRPPIANKWVARCEKKWEVLHRLVKQLQSNDSCLFAAYGGRKELEASIHRMQDLQAQLRMMQAILWLRAHPPSNKAELLAAIPPEVYSSVHRPLTLVDEGKGKALEIPTYDRYYSSNPTKIVLPLPEALFSMEQHPSNP